MSKERATTGSNAIIPFLFAAQPTAPLATKNPFSSKLSDPSAALPQGRSYPVPSFFDYRVKVKDHDSL